jgi:hypothetical protein
MTTFYVLLLALALVAATVLVHYEALRLIGSMLPRLPIRPHQRVVVVIAGCMLAHLVEVGLYALGYAYLYSGVTFGTITGDFLPNALDFFYFSLTSYTTLGIGDVYPSGPMRVMAGIESLNGFLMISWSASFTYVIMRRNWHPDE